VISDITGIYPNVNKPVFGKNCFGIESGVVSHYTQALKNAGFKLVAYPYMPEVVGRTEDGYLLGPLCGKLTIEFYLEKNGIEATSEQTDQVLTAVKRECMVRRVILTEEEFVKIAKETLA